MKKSVILAVLLVVFGVFVWKAENNKKTNQSDRPVVKIGVTIPLTGDSAEAGIATRAGMNMVLDKLQKDGDLRYDYQLVYEDNKASPASVATTTRKLIDVDDVNAVFSIWTFMGNVVESIANPKKVVNMTCSWETDKPFGKYTFSLIPTNDEMAVFTAEQLKDRGINSVALFIDDQGEFIIKDVRKRIKEAGIDIVFDERTPMESRDFKMEISKANAKNPDMYVLIGTPPMPFIFIKQLHEMTGKKNVTCFDCFTEMTAEQRVIAEGLWQIDDNITGNVQFEKDMIENTGIETNSCAGNSAANLQILVNAYENAKLEDGEVVPNSDNIVEYIKNNTKDFDTVAGPATIINNNVINVSPLVKIVKDGKMVNLED